MSTTFLLLAVAVLIGTAVLFLVLDPRARHARRRIQLAGSAPEAERRVRWAHVALVMMAIEVSLVVILALLDHWHLLPEAVRMMTRQS